VIIDKNFSPLMERCFTGKAFSAEETKALMQSMLDDTLSDIRIASVLTAFRFISITKENVLAIIEACLEGSVQIPQLSIPNIVDCGGTGSDVVETVNISTMSSLVAASAGAHVTKFSGKSLSAKSGSSSVLKYLDISPAEDEASILMGLKEVGIVFLNAADFYPTLKNLSEIRKTLGFKTIIDLVFPLANPVKLSGQVVGVYQKDIMQLMSECLRELGRKRALVVMGEDGLDEISVCAPTYISKLENNKIINEVWKPSDFNMKTHQLSELKALNVDTNAQILMQVVNGRASEAIMHAVEMNAAAILWCSNISDSIQDSLTQVRNAISSGKTLKTFEIWKHKS
jgi:anthranilate phosphoribosyltransferase